MSEIRLNIIDREGSKNSEIHEYIADIVVAALDPDELLDEIDADPIDEIVDDTRF